MKAMVMAAGNGSGLRPLTDAIPKALASVSGVTLLEIIVGRLRAAGVDEVVINVHHHAAKLEEFVGRKRDFGLSVKLSPEPELLDTGGGLKAARRHLEGGAFFLHNVDIVSDIDLPALMSFHLRTGGLATLAVRDAPAERVLLADEEGMLCGHHDFRSGLRRLPRRPSGCLREFAFCGIQALSPDIFQAIDEEGRFSIIDAYLNLAGKGCELRVWDAGDCFWRDLGRVESLASLLEDAGKGVLPCGILELAGSGVRPPAGRA